MFNQSGWQRSDLGCGCCSRVPNQGVHFAECLVLAAPPALGTFCFFDEEIILTAMDRTANSLLVRMGHILTADRPGCLDHTSPVSLRENEGRLEDDE